MIKETEISMQFHPRAFAAFGSDLVTNDDVALTELVKNSYDAFAYNVQVLFRTNQGNDYIEIIDDGLGMTQEVIKKAWAVIATPYKKANPTIKRDGKIRIVSGNKGLGRFAASRLGSKLSIITKSEGDICFLAKIDWQQFSNSNAISDCKFTLKEFDEDTFITYLHNHLKPKDSRISRTGTILRIEGLNRKWDSETIASLKYSLARLITPFKVVSDFFIHLSSDLLEQDISIEAPTFISHPTYSIRGHVDNQGRVKWHYEYQIKGAIKRSIDDVILWRESKNGFDRGSEIALNAIEEAVEYKGGPFSFEIRAWDLDVNSVAEISTHYDLKRSNVRAAISQYKGLSIYRDGVLVLPKSDSSKDWLGVDLRRVSALGKRMSTSQLIGIFNISSKDNPELKDTTDREKLVDTDEYKQFLKICETIIVTLENLRNLDRSGNLNIKQPTLSNLLEPLEVSKFESKVEMMVKAGASSSDVLEVVQDYAVDTQKKFNDLNNRLVYYAQTASLGSVAVVILHEIRNGLTPIQRFLNRLKPQFDSFDSRTKRYYEDSSNSHKRLLDVADSFAPLCRNGLVKENNMCDLLLCVNDSIRLVRSKKESKMVRFVINLNQHTVVMHQGELQTVLINIIDNACYWLQKTKMDEKVIVIKEKRIDDKKICITISDNGPGIEQENKEIIFHPGITSKPNGIGMGLVIVSELLHAHDCKISTVVPGLLGGASFSLELPVKS